MQSFSPSTAVDISWRPDGRMFLSVEAWSPAELDRASRSAIAALPRPLHTVVDEEDLTLREHWSSCGFTESRRESILELATRPAPEAASDGPPVELAPLGSVSMDRLARLRRRADAEVRVVLGWDLMPAVVTDPGPSLEARLHAVAAYAGRDAGLIRVTGRPRQPRIGLVAVLTEARRRGVATAMVAYALDDLHHRSVETAVVEIDERNEAARLMLASFEPVRVGGQIELVLR